MATIPIKANPSPYQQVEIIFTKSPTMPSRPPWHGKPAASGLTPGAFWIERNAMALLYSDGGSGGYARTTTSLARAARAALKDLGA
jgi:hypothetical protein